MRDYSEPINGPLDRRLLTDVLVIRLEALYRKILGSQSARHPDHAKRILAMSYLEQLTRCCSIEQMIPVFLLFENILRVPVERRTTSLPSSMTETV